MKENNIDLTKLIMIILGLVMLGVLIPTYLQMQKCAAVMATIDNMTVCELCTKLIDIGVIKTNRPTTGTTMPIRSYP